MVIIRDFTIKSRNDVVPGELIRLENLSNRLLAIVAPPSAAGHPTRMVVLQAQPRASAFVLRDLRSENVVSFGTEWILEMRDAPTVAVGNREHIDDLGVIRIAGDDVFLHCRNAAGFQEEFYFNLTTWQDINLIGGPVAPVFAWEIWANEDHRNRSGAMPLLSFSVDNIAPAAGG